MPILSKQIPDKAQKSQQKRNRQQQDFQHQLQQKTYDLHGFHPFVFLFIFILSYPLVKHHDVNRKTCKKYVMTQTV